MRDDPLRNGRRSLEQAAADLHWAEHLAQQGGYHIACFLSQQVVERAVKAFLFAQGEEIVLGHSVERLCTAASQHRPEFAVKARTWNLLDGYYIPTRYPSGLPDGIPADVFTRDAAMGAVLMANEAVSWIGQLLDQMDPVA